VRTRFSASCLLGVAILASLLHGAPTARTDAIRFSADVPLPAAPALRAYCIETPSATYYLEKSGAGLASIIDREGRDWLGFRPDAGSRAAGEFRGFPNAVHQQAGNYFHPKNQGTELSTTKVEAAGPDRVTISAVSANGLWACRYEFVRTHCTFTMTKMSPAHKYWILYEGTPGGSYDDTDWWMTSAITERQPLTTPHEGDIPSPEWIVFGDPSIGRVLFLLSHEDDSHPDRFYAMDRQMTVFGFGRRRAEKHLATVPRQFSIGLLDTTEHAGIARAMTRLLTLDR
jgi:hypothetical protein